MELIINNDNFQNEILQSEIPVLVDFYADWCGPCNMMAPILSSLANDFEGRLKVGKCNIETEMELANQYNVMSIPTLIIFKDGMPADTLVGALSKSELVGRLNLILG